MQVTRWMRHARSSDESEAVSRQGRRVSEAGRDFRHRTPCPRSLSSPCRGLCRLGGSRRKACRKTLTPGRRVTATPLRWRTRPYVRTRATVVQPRPRPASLVARQQAHPINKTDADSDESPPNESPEDSLSGRAQLSRLIGGHDRSPMGQALWVKRLRTERFWAGDGPGVLTEINSGGKNRMHGENGR